MSLFRLIIINYYYKLFAHIYTLLYRAGLPFSYFTNNIEYPIQSLTQIYTSRNLSMYNCTITSKINGTPKGVKLLKKTTVNCSIL